MKTAGVTIILSSNRESYTLNPMINSAFDSILISSQAENIFSCLENQDHDDLNRFIESNTGKFIVGYIGYDTGCQCIEKNKAKKTFLTNLPLVWLMAIEPDQVKKNDDYVDAELPLTPSVKITGLTSKQTYIEKLAAIKKNIQLGDIYEINYCIPFIAESIELDEHIIWKRLQHISPMPFAAFINHPEFTIISASPERFMKKNGNRLMIQPMKGTKKRGINVDEDDRFKEELKVDKKEQAENVMIVDLTRNDLSKIASRGSVQVDELFGIQTFKSVHQMVSTISCELKAGINFKDILEATFPMGSMTGAPKKRAMQLINEYEDFSRGPFSGMLGYIDQNNDFDFNVMIRTIFYSKTEKKLFMAVGSAITASSDVEKEYEECLIKLQPLLQALNATIE